MYFVNIHVIDKLNPDTKEVIKLITQIFVMSENHTRHRIGQTYFVLSSSCYYVRIC